MKKLLLVLISLVIPSLALAQAPVFLDEQLVVVANIGDRDRVMDVFIPSQPTISDESPYGQFQQFIEVAKLAYSSSQIQQKTIFGIPYYCISKLKFLSLLNSLGSVSSTPRLLTLMIAGKNYTFPNLNSINSTLVSVCNQFIGFPSASAPEVPSDGSDKETNN